MAGPMVQKTVWRQTGYVANADVFGTDITPRQGYCVLRITGALSAAGATPKLVIKDNAATPNVELFPVSDIPLGADEPFRFEFDLRNAEDAGAKLTYNFRFDVGGTIKYLVIAEMHERS